MVVTTLMTLSRTQGKVCLFYCPSESTLTAFPGESLKDEALTAGAAICCPMMASGLGPRLSSPQRTRGLARMGVMCSGEVALAIQVVWDSILSELSMAPS